MTIHVNRRKSQSYQWSMEHDGVIDVSATLRPSSLISHISSSGALSGPGC